MRVGTWQRANSGAEKGKQSKPPAPFPRPGTGAAKRHKKNDRGSPDRQAARQRALARAAARKKAIADGEIS